MNNPLLTVNSLEITFGTGSRRSTVVEDLSLRVPAGRTLALVGESGSGKSVTALAIMGLLARPAGRVSAGQIRFDGMDLLRLPSRKMSDLRGNRIAMIFQEPMTSLNPAFTIGDQIVEVLVRHRRMSQRDARRRAIEMLDKVRIPAPDKRFDEYPHQLSGGMRQRAMIAMALVCEPSLLIADEPTTALDVTIQAQILDLLRELQRESGTAIVLITHDLGVVAELADDVAVIYAGQIVEQATADALFEAPQHPYTVGLLGSMPLLAGGASRLAAISGHLPLPGERRSHCLFETRCPFAQPDCLAQANPLREVAPAHASACRRAPLRIEQLLAPARTTIVAGAGSAP